MSNLFGTPQHIDWAKEYDRMRNQITPLSGPSGAHTHMVPFQHTKPRPFSRQWGMDLLRGRMREDGDMGFEYVDLYINQERVLLFVVTKTDSVILDDDPALFPSDKLIAELRMLRG